MKKNQHFEAMCKEVASHFNQEQNQRIINNMKSEYENLCSSFKLTKDPMERHKRNNIFPVIVCYHALLKEGMNKDDAVKMTGDCFLVLMDMPANMIRKMMKIPGAYKLMPTLWKKLMPRLFSEDSGFRFKFYPTDKNQVKFDMVACPYLRICKEMDCIELAPIFCATDDKCYGHMHPKLIWNRTKTMARKDDLCDFDLYIKK